VSKRLVLLLTVSLTLLLSGAALASTLRFEQYGFSIGLLEGAWDKSQDFLVMQMSLPVTSDGFAPNVNVLIQVFDGTLEDYVNVSRQELQRAGLTVLRAEIVDGAYAVFEHTGTMAGVDLRWYAKAVPGDGVIYLATATATQRYWDAVKDLLIATVDSLSAMRN